MSRAISTKDVLRRLVPMDSLSEESLDKLAAKVVLQQIPAGKTLFKRGDREKTAFYVLRGEVRLTGADGKAKSVMGGSPEAAHALAPQHPRQFTGTTGSEATVVQVDTELLDILLTWDQSAGYVVEEISPEAEVDDDADWMTRMLRSNIFYRVPAANIHAILTRMESVHARKGEAIIEQGAEGDYFYILKSGKVEIVREANGRETRLAEKGVGDGFGEEALLSNAKRNATVRMLSDGELMRLAKKDFEELLKAPVLEEISHERGEALVESGAAVWVDVRLENEHKNDAIPGSINIPLAFLRMLSKHLPAKKSLIVYCDTGRRSSAAAYLLSERGFEVYVLKGGYAQAVQAKVA